MQNPSSAFKPLYFSFSGRIPRSTYWLRFYVPCMLLFLLTLALDFSLGTFNEEYNVGLFGFIFSLALLYSMVAIYVKRLHDRDHSGWFALLLLVPLVNLWPAIEIMFLRGTKGPNRFGADPADEAATAAGERVVA